MKLNKLLSRQIKRKFGDESELPAEVWDLLLAVSQSYDHYDRDRKLIERAMDLSSRELRETYEKLAITADLKRSNKELRQFVAIASHDLKAPLRTIGSFSTLLKRKLGEDIDPEAKTILEYIISGTKQMDNLIKDLLDYARLGSQSDKEEEVDLNTILKIVRKNLTFNIEESEAVIKIGKLPTVRSIPSQMIQLFQNLLSNAIKFRGKKAPVISVYSSCCGENWVICVEDNGIGIEAEYKERVFELFQRINNVSDYEGSGLGLSICKKIVDSLNGDIWLESEFGKGTTFYIALPPEIIIDTVSPRSNSCQTC